MKNERIAHLSKTIEAMKRSKSKSILLELDYLEDLLNEVSRLEAEVAELQNEKLKEKEEIHTILHGGKF